MKGWALLDTVARRACLWLLATSESGTSTHVEGSPVVMDIGERRSQKGSAAKRTVVSQPANDKLVTLNLTS